MHYKGSPPRVRVLRQVNSAIVNWPVDHPRVCGSYHGLGLGLVYVLGSPPRVRVLPRYF